MEFITEFFWFFLQLFFWYWFISLIFTVWYKVQEHKLDEKLEILEKVNDIVHRVAVEKHGDQYYWFDSDDNEFLAQGKDLDETLDRIKKRYPNHIFFVADKTHQYKISAATEWKLEPYKTVENGSN